MTACTQCGRDMCFLSTCHARRCAGKVGPRTCIRFDGHEGDCGVDPEVAKRDGVRLILDGVVLLAYKRFRKNGPR